MPKINPEILIWARKTASLTLDEAAKKLSILDTQNSSAVDRLAEFETTGILSRSLLVKMSKAYRRPLLTFYMAAPPRKGNRGQDFRTLPKDYSASENAFLDVLIRNVVARQSIVHSALEEDEEVEPLQFIGSSKMSDGVAAVLASIRKTLQINQGEFYAQSSPDDAFALLRESAEAKGVFVLLIGDLGSWHTKIDTEIFRGFALVDSIAPFIIINDQDSHSAWSFTLLHELTHLWLGQTGVSNSIITNPIEKFCNDVAGEFLLSADKLASLTVNDDTPFDEALEEITEFATERNLSSSMVAYKLYRAGAIQEATWNNLSKAFRDMWRQNRVKHREAPKSEGGPDYYVIRKQRIGKALIQLVDRMMLDGSLSTSKAGKVLGVKAKNVGYLIETARSD